MESSDDEYVEDKAPRRARNLTTDNGAYRWEDEYHRSWDVVQEDSGGSLATSVAELADETKRRRALQKNAVPVHRGIIRNLVLVIDLTQAMNDTDMRPTRFANAIQVAQDFVTEYFSQNPISQLAIVGIKNGLAHIISPLDGSPEAHIARLQKCRQSEPSGVPSLQNALELAIAVIAHVPSHGTREVLLIFGALMSNDPGPMTHTIDKLISARVRVRVVGLAAQVAVCRQIAEKTNAGRSDAYAVALNEHHFRQLVMESTTPLALYAAAAHHRATAVAVRMGFPKRTRVNGGGSLCSCHAKLTTEGFTCPQCSAKVCTLPMACPVCGLTLILSTHLARSYHHLFPLRPFVQGTGQGAGTCFGCSRAFQENLGRYRCTQCENDFCIDCDVFMHESLHNCAGCEVKPVQ